MTNNRRPTTTSDNAARVWQTRTDLVKQEMAVASAAADAKTAKLRVPCVWLGEPAQCATNCIPPTEGFGVGRSGNAGPCCYR